LRSRSSAGVAFVLFGFFFVLLIARSGCVKLLLRVRLEFLYHPVEDEVVVIAHPVEEILEQLSEIGDIGLLFKFHRSAVVQINIELVREALG